MTEAFKYMNFKKTHPDAIVPTRAHDTDAGYDLYATEDTVLSSIFRLLWEFLYIKIKDIAAGEWTVKVEKETKKLLIDDEPIFATKVNTGICLEIPKGYAGIIHDRSGLGSKLIKTFGGVIDSGYLGNIQVCLANFSFHDYNIKKGERVAQIIFKKIESFELNEVDELGKTERGETGFGASGK